MNNVVYKILIIVIHLFILNVVAFGAVSRLEQQLTEDKGTTIAYSGDNQSILKRINEYAPLIGSITAVLAISVTLWLSVLRPMYRKPRLKLAFLEDKKFPYFHELAFGELDHEIVLDGQPINILLPGFNARAKVYNDGKITATNAQARIEKIELHRNNSPADIRYYHPTNIKWSGEPDWNPVDIAPKSFFFLDVFFSISEMTSDIVDFNYLRLQRLGIELDKKLLVKTVEDISPRHGTYWNVWVKHPHLRGVPIRYDFEGDILISIILNAENAEAVRFEAQINWSKETWKRPSIKILQNARNINEDI